MAFPVIVQYISIFKAVSWFPWAIICSLVCNGV